MSDWYVHYNGQQQGPFPSEKVARMVQEGTISRGDLAWCEGMAQWSTIEAIPEFSDDAGAPASSMIETLPQPVPVGVIDDTGPFWKIGSQFTVGGKRWVGKSVASPQAVYLLKTRRVSQAGLHGGLAGALLAAAFTSQDDTRTRDITELFPAVREQLDRKQKRKSGDVVIIRKAAVSYVKVPGINNVVTFTVAGERVKVNTGVFAVGRAGRFLAENGWSLNQELQPTEAPIHGAGFGRDASQAKEGPGVFRRVLYVLIAIVIIALVIWIRTMSDH